jgi:hypothetical protein
MNTETDFQVSHMVVNFLTTRLDYHFSRALLHGVKINIPLPPHLTPNIKQTSCKEGKSVPYPPNTNTITTERHIYSQAYTEHATGFLSTLFYQFC